MFISLRHTLACCLAVASGTLVWMACGQESGPPSTPAGQTSTVVPSTSASTRKVNSSVSATRQFVVHGADLNVRSSICLLSEEISSNLGRLLKDDAKYSIPVVVVLKTPPDITQTDPAVSTNISQLTHGGFHLQMTAQLRPDFRTEDYARELVRVLLAERILRDHQELSTSRQRVLPDWLLTGVTQAMEFRSRSKPSVLFAAVFRSGQVYSIDNILSADPAELDALSRGIYEVSSCALLLALLEQPDAPLRFSKFLNALASSNTPDRELLQQHFPAVGISKNSLEKWWTLQMAALSTPTAMETMSVADTEKELATALTFRFEESDGEKDKESGKRSSKKRSTPSPASAPAPAPAPVTEAPPAEVKKPGGFLGFGKGKSEKKEEETPAPSPAPAPAIEPAKPKPAVPAPVATPAPEVKPSKEKEAPALDAPPEEKSFFRNPFKSGKKVIFPFDRKKKEEAMKEEDAPSAKPRAGAEKPASAPAPAAAPAKPKVEKAVPKEAPAPEKTKAAKPAEKPPEKPSEKEKKTEPAPATEPPEVKSLPRKPRAIRSVARQPDASPKPDPVTAPAPDPLPQIPSLSRKPESMRGVGSQPDDLPSVMPPPAPVTGNASTATETEAEKASRLNPLNWFRKDEAAPADPNAPIPGQLPGTVPARSTAKSHAHEPESSRSSSEKHIASYPLEDYARIAKRPDKAKILQRTLEQLSSLRLRTHPLYKQLITEYIGTIERLMAGKDKGLTTELGALKGEHVKVREKALAVESYLDWYEASEIHTYSGTFDDYLNLRKKLEEEIRPRNDAISKYLDALEKEYE